MAQLPPAGWHPDPMGRHAQRYWDGQQWTDHVADVAGNMTTDPLSGSSDQGQARQAAGQQQAAAGQAATQQATDQAPQQQAAQQPTASSEPAGSTPTASQNATTQQQAAADGPATSTAADTGDRSETPTWGGTSGTDTADTDETRAETGQAAAGTAAAAWGATSTTDTAPSATDDASTADAPTADRDDLEATTGSVISSAGLVAIAVDEEGVLTNRMAVVARQDSVATSDEEAGHRLHGSGTAWLGGGGRHVAVIEVTGAGLVVGNDHLVAHSAGLTSEDAHSGITGFEATRLSGTGWAAIAAAGGVAEMSTVGGVSVAEGALVGHTADLDVAHIDDVQLGGHGVALVSPGG